MATSPTRESPEPLESVRDRFIASCEALLNATNAALEALQEPYDDRESDLNWRIEHMRDFSYERKDIGAVLDKRYSLFIEELQDECERVWAFKLNIAVLIFELLDAEAFLKSGQELFENIHQNLANFGLNRNLHRKARHLCNKVETVYEAEAKKRLTLSVSTSLSQAVQTMLQICSSGFRNQQTWIRK
ncbi:hypothetical protein ABW20_dc0108522 [Dactylellina cionopaga]|nr:hypothetical protein ABW20_dc0108522 [Dactylellina cionopaga]